MTCAVVNSTSGYRSFSRLVSLRTRSSILTSTAVSLATFAHHLACRLVGAQTLERRCAQLAGPCPLHELELCHQLLEHRVAETGADLSDIHKLLVLVVVADQQRTRIAAALALALEPAPDDQLLAVPVLHLEPRAAATARLVT